MSGHTHIHTYAHDNYSKGWFTIRRKACVRCAAYVVTQRNVSMASSEINAKNATQRYSVAQLNLDSPQ